MVRAKMYVDSIKEEHPNQWDLRMSCVYSEDIPEDKRFCEATPAGDLRMMITNKEAVKQFEQGKTYYVDFTKTE